MASEPDTGVHISPERAAEVIEAGAVVVDVRRDYEWEAGRLAGSRHIEVNDLTGAAERIDRERPVVFVCRAGNRSGMAAEAFSQAGWDAYHVVGGLQAWVEAGLPLEGEMTEPRLA